MSSIYRKGRDGYFYYQTYVDNPKTGKKDKRIFHSLGTKDRVVAEKKQIDFDAKYSRLDNKTKNSYAYFYFLRNKRTVTTVIATIFMTIMLSEFYHRVSIKNKSNKSTIVPTVILQNPINTDTISSYEKTETIEEKIINRTKIYAKDLEVKPVKSDSFHISEIILPDYEIIRIDSLSQNFKQGKIYVTVDENTSNKSQLYLCKTLSQRYKEFSNIIICIYANNPKGLELANGRIHAYNADDQRRYWLSMYTFNPVEGEYFDNHPNRYLGTN